jgi:ABC-type sugar transport system ATPase subunit
VQQLSGGNQQKVVLAKWLAREGHIIVLDEPTRGIDVGAKVEMYHLINQLSLEGKAVILISSDMPELISLSDRIYVMRQGRFVAELESRKTSQEEILALPQGSRKPRQHETGFFPQGGHIPIPIWKKGPKAGSGFHK